jgi:GAF domain-containing protein
VSGDAARDQSGFSAPTDENARRLHQLARVTTELGAAQSIDAVVEAAVNHMADAIRATVTTLMIRDGSDLVLVGGYGLSPGVFERWQRFPISAKTPASEAARTSRPVFVGAPERIESRYPPLRDDYPEGRSVVALPLGAGRDPVGVVALTFADGWLPGSGEMDLLTAFAEACGQAIRRIDTTRVAGERSRQLSFLADASAELARSLDYRATLTKVANLCVPVLADWCAVDVFEGGTLTTLAVAHRDPEMVSRAWELQRKYPPDPTASAGAFNVIRTGVSELYDMVTDEMTAAAARDDEHLRRLRELNVRSVMIVPLRVRERTLGTITLIRASEDRRFGPADLGVAEDLGRRAGTAIDNAQLHGEAVDVAIQLQRAVLPESLDHLPGWRIATHYEPGGNSGVGGDFYDAVALPGGRLAAFIGDVMGHGLEAAAAMAQLRAAVRAFISVDPEPEAVLDRLERMFEFLSITRLVSLLYAVVDPAGGSLEIVNAGHYPPLVVGKDGGTAVVETRPRRPLGMDPDNCTATRFAFNATDTLLLFTDGLVERRTEHIDIGLQRLQKAADLLAADDLRGGLRSLVARVYGADGDDDVTALAVRAQ